MSYAMISTWRMTLDGLREGMKVLEQGGKIGDAIVKAVCNVEDNPIFNSVGYGGLPNKYGEVELDAAYMNGDTLGFGGIMAVKNLKNPILVAKKLSEKSRNCLLASEGARKFAEENSYEFRNMLHPSAKNRWLEEMPKKVDEDILEAYKGHDTACVLGIDSNNSMAIGVSTCGLFMKDQGRVGDSAIIGSGLYVDSSIGGAAATGLGEDIMKGCLSYEIVRLMRDRIHPQQACETAIEYHYKNMCSRRSLIGSMCVIAMNSKGEWGAATNDEEFSFVAGTCSEDIKVYLARRKDGKISVSEAEEEWLRKYIVDLQKGTGI